MARTTDFLHPLASPPAGGRAHPLTRASPPVSPSTRMSPSPLRPNGVLLLNVGTPDAPDARAVRRYLREFLSDPRVMDLPAPLRWVLLNLVILPTRPRKSAEAYRKVWTEQGSPLLVHSLALRDGLRERLGDGFRVELGMGYGKPSIARALEQLREQGADRLVVVPLFPQLASATTGTVLEAVFREVGRRWNVPSLFVLPPFFDEPGFLDAFADAGKSQLASFQPDHVLFSFHGLPERHIKKSDDSGSRCLAGESCCAELGPENRNCYRAQCFQTARELASRLALAEGSWTVTFQSRLGRTPWIRPHTDATLGQLGKNGVKRLLVFCPAFVADCLETLEEVAIRGREQFVSAGGEALELVPSLNARPLWVDALAQLIERLAPAPRRALPLLASVAQ